MLRQQFSVDNYWEVVVYYDADYNLFSVIHRELELYGVSETDIQELYHTMYTGKAKAVTVSSTLHHVSIILFNRHFSKSDYISSIVHEAEHVKQAMLRAYRVEDAGEPPAYTIGYLVSRLYEVFRKFL